MVQLGTFFWIRRRGFVLRWIYFHGESSYILICGLLVLGKVDPIINCMQSNNHSQRLISYTYRLFVPRATEAVVYRTVFLPR